MDKQIFKILQSVGAILLGNTLYALALVAFIIPNEIIMGGSSGLGMSVHHYFKLPISTFVLFFNIIMFIIGGYFLGKKFALTTIISTFYFPVILGLFQQIPRLHQLTDDAMLATVAGGLLVGIGIGIVIKNGASTGGMDIPVLICNKKIGVPVSVLIYTFDITILVLQMIYSDIEHIIYGIILVLIYSTMIDKILLSGTSRMQVQIISKKTEEINQYILHTLDRGSTLLYGETGFFRKEQTIILTVISNRELVKLKQDVKIIDPKAFLIMSHVNEVSGSGFSRQKVYREMKHFKGAL